jgi:hypothetical protein
VDVTSGGHKRVLGNEAGYRSMHFLDVDLLFVMFGTSLCLGVQKTGALPCTLHFVLLSTVSVLCMYVIPV